MDGETAPKSPVGKVLTTEELFADFLFALEQNLEGGMKPYQFLPSGNYLHNPAQKKVISADRWVARESAGVAAAGAKWLDGMHNPKRDPVQAAIDKDAKWKDKMKAAIDADTHLHALQNVNKADIIAVVDKLGSTVYTNGFAARTAKVTRKISKLQPIVQSVSDTIQAMDDSTDSAREQRLLSARKLMIAAGLTMKGA